jgi:hypothetical protein
MQLALLLDDLGEVARHPLLGMSLGHSVSVGKPRLKRCHSASCLPFLG